MKDDLLCIQAAIHSRHGCDCRHLSSTVVNERVAGKEWCGRVEIWELFGNTPAPYCYGWREADGEVVTVLQIPPVISPSTAVRFAAMQHHRLAGAEPRLAEIGEITTSATRPSVAG